MSTLCINNQELVDEKFADARNLFCFILILIRF